MVPSLYPPWEPLSTGDRITAVTAGGDGWDWTTRSSDELLDVVCSHPGVVVGVLHRSTHQGTVLTMSQHCGVRNEAECKTCGHQARWCGAGWQKQTRWIRAGGEAGRETPHLTCLISGDGGILVRKLCVPGSAC